MCLLLQRGPAQCVLVAATGMAERLIPAKRAPRPVAPTQNVKQTLPNVMFTLHISMLSDDAPSVGHTSLKFPGDVQTCPGSEDVAGKILLLRQQIVKVLFD